jgi:serine phosphatase RsbU (regulator of sigma subunit)
MINPFRTHGFERRLLVFFLLLSVTPTVVIALVGVRYFLDPVERVSSPALRASFSNSMEIARQYSMTLERNAATACAYVAEDFRHYRRSGTPRERALSLAAEKAHADFGAVYVRNDSVWVLSSTFPQGFARLDATMKIDGISLAGGPQKVDFMDQDIVASAVMNGPDSLIVAGFALEAGMTDRMRKTSEDLSLYGSAGQWVSTMRLYVIIIFSVIVALAAISSAAVSRLLARRISHPIQELANATDRIAEGDLTHRVDVKARDEINSLVSSFNNMTQELQENKRNLIAMAKREAQVARDFEIARHVQQNLFPTMLPEAAGWQFAATCRPARAVGGDYYDVFEVAPGKVLFAQGDVSGKGLGASLVMAGVHAVIRSWAGALQDNPRQLISELNQYLISSSSIDTFVTLFLGLLDCQMGQLRYINCGHPPALMVRGSNGTTEELLTGGTILGIIDEDRFETGECRMASGDSLILVSDGVTEATNPADEMFDMHRLLTVVDLARDRSAPDTMQGIIQAVHTFMAGCEQADDISILVLKQETKVSL